MNNNDFCETISLVCCLIHKNWAHFRNNSRKCNQRFDTLAWKNHPKKNEAKASYEFSFQMENNGKKWITFCYFIVGIVTVTAIRVCATMSEYNAWWVITPS